MSLLLPAVRRRGGFLPGLACVLAVATAGPARAQDVDWQVPGGARALEPTVQVRVVVENDLPPEAVAAELGLVQTVVYLYSSGGPAAPLLEEAGTGQGLWPASGGLPGDADRATIRVPGVEDDQVALALVLGRPLRIQGEAGPDALARGAVRADAGDLADRRRWAVDTLVPVGQERLVWQGAVPLDTDRLYADYLAVRAERSPTPVAGTPEALPPDPGEGGILRLPSGAPPPGTPAVPLTRGSTLVRSAGPRLAPLSLQRGLVNVLRLRATRDVTGTFTLELTASTVAPDREPGGR